MKEICIKAVNNGDWSGSFWEPAADDKQPWVEIDPGKAEKFPGIVIYESGRNIRSFELQYKSGESWKTFHRGDQIGERLDVKFKPVEALIILPRPND